VAALQAHGLHHGISGFTDRRVLCCIYRFTFTALPPYALICLVFRMRFAKMLEHIAIQHIAILALTCRCRNICLELERAFRVCSPLPLAAA
jgi:hypothetical protein